MQSFLSRSIKIFNHFSQNLLHFLKDYPGLVFTFKKTYFDLSWSWTHFLPRFNPTLAIMRILNSCHILTTCVVPCFIACLIRHVNCHVIFTRWVVRQFWRSFPFRFVDETRHHKGSVSLSAEWNAKHPVQDNNWPDGSRLKSKREYKNQQTWASTRFFANLLPQTFNKKEKNFINGQVSDSAFLDIF